MFADADALLKGLPDGTFPPLELEWLVVSAWNRGCHHERFGRAAAAKDFKNAARDLVRHRGAKGGHLEVGLVVLRLSVKNTSVCCGLYCKCCFIAVS